MFLQSFKIVYLNEILQDTLQGKGGLGHPPASGSISNAKMLRIA